MKQTLKRQKLENKEQKANRFLAAIYGVVALFFVAMLFTLNYSGENQVLVMTATVLNLVIAGIFTRLAVRVLMK